ncbi:hypothetical protein [Paludibacterium denitrificans]|uniref:Uncharacterized protein n=1 Tax=Paludibacterium denitrificans TaxID=2675226 RepID=A0A844GBH2_9NEIS|nr:hypothetical protein [Paludibacterium denitrificans]MTD32588.1 hypothetical protein [Paludibacterium denitrificans]
MLQSLAEQDTARAQLEEQLARQESAQSALRQALQKEKNTSQIMMGVIILAYHGHLGRCLAEMKRAAFVSDKGSSPSGKQTIR